MRLSIAMLMIGLVSGACAAPQFTAKQQAFITKFKPQIQLADQGIMADRKKVLADQALLKTGKTLSKEDRVNLHVLGSYYKLTKCSIKHWSAKRCVKALKNRVDILPTDLVLAQAINESSWGQSRFAKQGNNYFGIWCFTKGCGMVPNSRPKGANYEVRRFADAEHSIEAYYRIINTHSPYLGLRNARAKMRAENKPLSAYDLAAGLEGYSTRKLGYVKSIRSIIRLLSS